MKESLNISFLRRVSLFFLPLIVCMSASAQLSSSFVPMPQELNEKIKLDKSTHTVRYVFKFKRHAEQVSYDEDMRVVQIGKKVVKDFSESIYHYDSLATANFAKGLSASSVNPENPYPFEIFNNSETKKCDIKYRLILHTGTLSYSTPLPKFDWKILDKQEKLFGYTCNKATTTFGGRKYTAWYTIDIPLPYGPYKFGGLPGLILKIEDSDKMYVWELASFAPKASDIYMYTYDKEQKTTPKEARKIIKRMNTTPYGFLHANGSKVNVRGADGVFRPRTKDEKVYKFDPIELD